MWSGCCERNWSCSSECFDTVCKMQGGRQQSKHSVPVISLKSLMFRRCDSRSEGAVILPGGERIVLFKCCFSICFNVLVVSPKRAVDAFIQLLVSNDSLLPGLV